MKHRKSMGDREFIEKMGYLLQITEMSEQLERAQNHLVKEGLSCVAGLIPEIKRRKIENPFKEYDLSSMPLAGKPYGKADDSILTTEEACAYLRISRPTFLNKYIYSGQIKATKIGKGWKVMQSELNRFLLGG
jgi:excisionase family DNA binding protein